MSKADEIEDKITLNDYVLTNLNLDGYFTIRLKDGKEYICYKKGKTHYIEKNNKKYLLDEEVNKAFMSNVREYNRYGI